LEPARKVSAWRVVDGMLGLLIATARLSGTWADGWIGRLRSMPAEPAPFTWL
jgi:hypothetical protein